ncbi:MAG: flavodoxin domain-containing protein [Sedimentibacter sp.]
MNILIAYASSNSTTEECANFLAQKLPGSHVKNLKKDEVDISDYDTVIIGSCIRFNNIHNAVIDFIKENLEQLMKKNTAIFLCCGFPEKANQYLLHNFPKKLLNKSVSIQCFGGNLKVRSYKLYDKLVMKTVQKNFKLENRKFTEIDYDRIQEMADEILKLNK